MPVTCNRYLNNWRIFLEVNARRKTWPDYDSRNIFCITSSGKRKRIQFFYIQKKSRHDLTLYLEICSMKTPLGSHTNAGAAVEGWVFYHFLNAPYTQRSLFRKAYMLTHWGRVNMADIFQTFSNAFSWMKMYEFRLNFHWSLLLRVQHWFK